MKAASLSSTSSAPSRRSFSVGGSATTTSVALQTRLPRRSPFRAEAGSSKHACHAAPLAKAFGVTRLGRRREARNKFELAPIHFSSMSDGQNEHDKLSLLDLVNDAVISHPEPIQIGQTGEFHAPGRTRL